jgi:hypothetical protein
MLFSKCLPFINKILDSKRETSYMFADLRTAVVQNVLKQM